MNLALDEVLLDSLESGRAGETLRFWESPVPFVVLGVSQTLADHADEAACAELGVPILRRCSAGGAVLQGPGCLNFTLILTYDAHPEIGAIRSSYKYILGRITDRLSERGVAAKLAGTSDLAVGDMKFSGNAQRRRKRGILHHGTLLYGVDLDTMARCLTEPRDRPPYRGDRDHAGFVANLPLNAQELRQAVSEAFDGADRAEVPAPEELAEAQQLALEKYESPEWIHRR